MGEPRILELSEAESMIGSHAEKVTYPRCTDPFRVHNAQKARQQSRISGQIRGN